MTWEGPDDQRPLTKEGKQRMAQEAKTINNLDLKLDLILSSPLVRARQTAEIVAEKLEPGVDLVVDERLSPGFDSDHLAEILASHPDSNAVMLVGHEPDFSSMISYLVGGGELVCKKGGLARVDLLEENSMRGELVWLIPPKLLAR